MITKTEQDRQDRASALDYLRQRFPAGSTATTIVLHVSQSGMQRVIAVLAPDENDPTAVVNVSWQVACAIDGKMHRRYNGVLVNGAGMDMAFSLTYDLARALHGDGYALNQRTIS